MVHRPRNKKLYQAVRKARFKGLSYGVIAKEFNISKSNVSFWCRDIKLSAEQNRRLTKNSRRILELGAQANHQKRQKQIIEIEQVAEKRIKKISPESFLIAGVMLYWAEGHKSHSPSITNSDERIIIFMLQWLEKTFSIDRKKEINAHLHIHQGDNDLRIKKYWSKITGIPLINFGKSFVKPKGTGHRKHVLPHGVIRIRLTGKGSTDKRLTIMAWIDKIYKLTAQ